MNEFIFSLFMILYIIPNTLRFLFKLPYSGSTLFLSLLLFVVWPLSQAYRRRARKQKKAQQQAFAQCEAGVGAQALGELAGAFGKGAAG